MQAWLTAFVRRGQCTQPRPGFVHLSSFRFRVKAMIYVYCLQGQAEPISQCSTGMKQSPGVTATTVGNKKPPAVTGENASQMLIECFGSKRHMDTL